MAGLSTIIQTYQGVLEGAPASLVAMPEHSEIDDLPASKLHKRYVLRTGSGPFLRQIHGTTTVEYEAKLVLDVRLDPEIAGEQALELVVATLKENIMHAMLKASNRVSDDTGVLLTGEPGDGFSDTERISPTESRIVGVFTTRYRVTQDMS